MGKENDSSGKHTAGHDARTLRINKGDYEKFFKDVCTVIKEFNKKKERLEKVWKGKK